MPTDTPTDTLADTNVENKIKSETISLITPCKDRDIPKDKYIDISIEPNNLTENIVNSDNKSDNLSNQSFISSLNLDNHKIESKYRIHSTFHQYIVSSMKLFTLDNIVSTINELRIKNYNYIFNELVWPKIDEFEK